MNTRFKIFIGKLTVIAVMAAGAVSASCTRDVTPNSETDKVDPATEGTRVIAVSFAPSTKTTLATDGVTPKFSTGDSILISNGAVLDTCGVSVHGNSATITTDLTGPLKAVYPYKAADIYVGDISGVLVSTVQSGEFADANICVAENITTSATFENRTAVFRITPEAEDISYLEVSADGIDIANNVPTGSLYGTDKIHVDVPGTNQPKEYFVSILVQDSITIGALKFSDGTNVKTVTGDRASEAVAVNTIYKVTIPKSFAITSGAVSITGASFKVMKGSEEVTKASPGDELKVNVTCPYGYLIDKIKVFKTTDSSTTIEVTDDSFTMPNYPVTVKVEFELDESGGGTEMESGGLLP